MSLSPNGTRYHPDDRRAKRRFSIAQEVKYRLLFGEHLGDAGSGTTLNISSGGVCFTTDSNLSPGLPVEVAIEWPALLRESVPLRLVTYGIVVRSLNGNTAATIDRYEFRTTGLRAMA